MKAYVAMLLREDGDSEYGVIFPDFPGCYSAGETLSEAAEMAEEALALHTAVMRDEGKPLPEPMRLERAKDLHPEAVAFIVVPAGPDPRRVRVNITVPGTELARIDAYAKAHGYTRSGLLVEGALLKMREDEART